MDREELGNMHNNMYNDTGEYTAVPLVPTGGGGSRRSSNSSGGAPTTPNNRTSTFSGNSSTRAIKSEWTGYYGKFLKIRRSTRYVQNMMDNICRTFERIKNLLSWSQPQKTRAVLYVLLFLVALFSIVPTRHIVLIVGLYMFTENFRKQGTYVARTWHFINTVPSDVQVDDIYEEERSQFQERLNRGVRMTTSNSQHKDQEGRGTHLVDSLDVKGAKVDLHAVWEGYMQTYGRSRIGRTIQKKNTRYFALQSHGVLQWWLRRELAESGQKPRGELFFSTNRESSGSGSIVLPIDRNNEWELELRGFRDRDFKTRLVIVLIARSSPDREGWLNAVQQVMESMETSR
jgi:hypothetical protein